MLARRSTKPILSIFQASGHIIIRKRCSINCIRIFHEITDIFSIKLAVGIATCGNWSPEKLPADFYDFWIRVIATQ